MGRTTFSDIAFGGQATGFARLLCIVDTASRPGMSGAPVSWSNHMVESGVVALVDTPLHRLAIDGRGCHPQGRHGLTDARIAVAPVRSRCA
jgi:hypothetical protein